MYAIGQIVRLRNDRKWIGYIYEVGNNGYAPYAKVEWFCDVRGMYIPSYYMEQLEPL